MQFVIIGLIILFTLMFLACAVMFPELVGIAGKKAKEIEESHRADTSTEEKEERTENHQDN